MTLPCRSHPLHKYGRPYNAPTFNAHAALSNLNLRFLVTMGRHGYQTSTLIEFLRLVRSDEGRNGRDGFVLDVTRIVGRVEFAVFGQICALSWGTNFII